MFKIKFVDLFKTNNFTDRETDTFAKTIFSGSEGLKTWSFDKNGGSQILHKPNTFSDENVKILDFQKKLILNLD